MLKDKKIVLGVSGGIAVYKAVELASLLTKQGALVKIIMTKNAMEFVTPLTFKSITHQSVSYEMFNESAPIEHISIADWAEIFIIAPATANVIGKVAMGIADDLLTTSFMATQAKKIIVPAMNVNMYENSIVQNNIKILKDHGIMVLEPDSGLLACGYEGKGRFPDPKEILFMIQVISLADQDLKGKKILITGGASKEIIDPMRFISNNSSGKMALSIAKSAYYRGAEVLFIHGAVQDQIPQYLPSIKAEQANDMYEQVMSHFSAYDIIIMCAAVADYTIEKPAKEKIKKAEELDLHLTRTHDILLELGEKVQKEQVLIGFAAESEHIIENAKIKLKKKKCNFIVANSLYTTGQSDTEISIVKEDSVTDYRGSKLEMAQVILKEAKLICEK